MAEKGVKQEPATAVSPTEKEIEQQRDGSISDSSEAVRTGGLAGVERIEATTQAWTKPWLIAAYIL